MHLILSAQDFRFRFVNRSRLQCIQWIFNLIAIPNLPFHFSSNYDNITT
jgi:hypothetical protein